MSQANTVTYSGLGNWTDFANGFEQWGSERTYLVQLLGRLAIKTGLTVGIIEEGIRKTGVLLVIDFPDKQVTFRLLRRQLIGEWPIYEGEIVENLENTLQDEFLERILKDASLFV